MIKMISKRLREGLQYGSHVHPLSDQLAADFVAFIHSFESLMKRSRLVVTWGIISFLMGLTIVISMCRTSLEHGSISNTFSNLPRRTVSNQFMLDSGQWILRIWKLDREFGRYQFFIINTGMGSVSSMIFKFSLSSLRGHD